MDDTTTIDGHLGSGWTVRAGVAADRPPAALDLGGVTSVDACGVEELLGCATVAIRSGGGLRLENVRSDVAEDLLRLGLGDVLAVRRRSVTT
jgi:anti-anti-sigma regulatory factor